ncbi:ATPase domain-containing protein [Halodesulfurarchaeum sp.]|uniref:ATPase domain-containing protein n=1 Tax=Halodesulfurarchaeum sp. TaxID=1980530 RepID=UPI002FC3A399
MSTNDVPISQISTGVDGLDELLRGGFIKSRMYLVTGESGTAKTTLCMHYLHEGLAKDETVLYIHGEESAEELTVNAAQFGIDISGLEFLDMGPDMDFFTDDPAYDLVESSDIDQERYTDVIHEAIEEIDPTRIVIDPMTQLRYLETSDYHFRKRLLSFFRFLKQRGVTVLATATMGQKTAAQDILSLSDGVIELSRGEESRRIKVRKNRGMGQIEGDHGVEIRSNGLEVYPRIRPEPSDRDFDPTPVGSGISELDAMVNGGFERGTVTFITGPTGVGKTTLATQYLAQASRQLGKSVIYLFEERIETFEHRCRSLGIPIDELQEEGVLSIQVIEPKALSAEEFAGKVQTEVEEEGAETVMIDGVDGYTSVIQGDEEELDRDLNSLTRYLVNREVTVFITDATHEVTGLSSATSHKISQIADNLIFISYIELQGSLRKVIGVLKKRTGGFKSSFREFEITANGVEIGDPMTGYSGILHGLPERGPRPTTES